MNPAKYLALVKKDDIKGTLKEIWTMPYDADPILEPEFTGLTYGQVILMEQAKRAIGGDGGAVDRILDRLIGKPEQINKNMNISGTYAEWLEQIDKMEKETIDVEPTTTRSDQPTLE
ncbi:MAG: hypothetical protein KGI08_02570 [Thaumarchaeota archaeon]|nr:hypothetical protein [Nitrososphaerota archaeon]